MHYSIDFCNDCWWLACFDLSDSDEDGKDNNVRDSRNIDQINGELDDDGINDSLTKQTHKYVENRSQFNLSHVFVNRLPENFFIP